MNNFYIYFDRDGKMPVFDYCGIPVCINSHPYYIRYVNNKPVAYHGPAEVLAQDRTKSKVWDYSINEYVPIVNIPKE